MTPFHMRQDVPRIHQNALRAGKTPWEARQAVADYVNQDDTVSLGALERWKSRFEAAARYFLGSQR